MPRVRCASTPAGCATQWHTHDPHRPGAAADRITAPSPSSEITPEDAAAFGVGDQQLARLTGAGGEYRARVRLTKGQRRGEAFVPMHWTDRFTGAARTGGLLAAHLDPISGQPEAKHGAVSLAPLAVGWEATLLIAPGEAGDFAGRDDGAYWARIPLAHCQRWQLAGGETDDSPRDWLAWARQWLPTAPSLWSDDPAGGRLRAAGLENGRLRWWLMVAPPAELPGLSWLDARFAEATLEGDVRRRLLAGCDAGEADAGPLVCSCHQVGQTTIVEAIRAGDASVEALGARLACGTQCGSCIPELKSLVEEHAPDTVDAGADAQALDSTTQEESGHARSEQAKIPVRVA
ncbi:molybdopterin dinucleotide binding domain-containing protein [Halomonas smyrnensis]|uniref:molybdopterin dinucleotide binding domain-containing protein n=1 Tax=Halomonas smyrnensis TaxID=720605 RepID=UPI001ED99CF2|nr:molybdopterin dinucleotide binding domain-containing protein [Halomonas smyrnensis]